MFPFCCCYFYELASDGGQQRLIDIILKFDGGSSLDVWCDGGMWHTTYNNCTCGWTPILGSYQLY